MVTPTNSTAFTYDTNGNVLTKVVTDTTSYTTPYATNGRTRTWTYTYTSQGLLSTVTGPVSGSTTSYTYNSNGYLTKVTDPLGHATNITSVNGRGEPLTVVDPNGVTSNLAYDMDGHVTGVTINPGSSQSAYTFAYDAAGDLTQVTLPLGGYVQYTYDSARRLTQATNNRGQVTTYTLDANGDVTAKAATTSATGGTTTLSQTATFDELGRLLKSIGAASQTTTYGYDLVGNQTKVTDGRGNLFQAAFDPLNRLISQTDPESHTVTYGLDPSNAVKSLKDGAGHTTTRTIDGFGQVIQEVSPDRGTRSYWYDAAGNITKRIDGNGWETDATYDLANRITSKTFPQATWENIAYSYDATSPYGSTAGGNYGIGRLTLVTDESGGAAFTYDAQGRVVQELKVIQGQSYYVSYAYDANGKIIKETLPSGRIINIARATDGLITGVTTQASATAAVATLASNVSYLPFGPLSGLTYGNGLSLSDTYDANYWLTGIGVTGASSTTLSLTLYRDNAGSLTNITDNAATGRGAAFGYTPSGRLQYAVGPWGEYDYGYDGAGNMDERDTVLAGTKTYSFPVNDYGTNNQVTSVRDINWNATRTLTYQAGGDLYQDARSGGITYSYSYNARNRAVEIMKNNVEVGAYGYDAFEHRVWREVFSPSTVQTHYIYDLDGRLLAEQNGATGAVVKEYAWIDDMPLAVIDSSSGTPTTYYIHTGPVNEPLAMTNSAKAIVWNAYMEPFGAATVFGTASASIDMRLPGQSLEAESGNLNQNWFRDYDPSLGRYIEADPLGLEAGQNVYAYVQGMPLDFSDRRGLWSFSAQVYDGFGGGFVVGNDRSPGGGWFVSGRIGVGIGGGVNFDPKGEAPGKYPESEPGCPPLTKFGGTDLFGEAGVHLPFFEVDTGLQTGTNYAGDTYKQYVNFDTLHLTYTKDTGVGGGIDAGAEVTVFPTHTK